MYMSNIYIQDKVMYAYKIKLTFLNLKLLFQSMLFAEKDQGTHYQNLTNIHLVIKFTMHS